MCRQQWRAEICRSLDENGIAWQKDAPLAPLTTFRIGGPAALLCRPTDAAHLQKLLELLRQAGVRFYCLGRGSNTLFADEGFDGAVVATEALRAVTLTADGIQAQAGASLAAVCRTAQAAGLSGLEFAYGIPGSVGGAVYMNAGAYGGEMKDAVRTVQAICPNGSVAAFENAACRFAYRHSAFEENGAAVLSADFALRRDDPAAIAARMEEYAARRREKQPLEWPSAGSTFRRPQGGVCGCSHRPVRPEGRVGRRGARQRKACGLCHQRGRGHLCRCAGADREDHCRCPGKNRLYAGARDPRGAVKQRGRSQCGPFAVCRAAA